MSRMFVLARLLVESPGSAVRQVLDHRADSLPLLLAAWGVCAGAVADAAAGPGFALGSAATLLAVLLGAAVTLLIGGSALHLSAEILGGEGQILDLMRVLALAFFPGVLLPVFVLSGDTVYGLVRLAVVVWQVFIIVAALRETYSLPSSGAILALLAPVLFVFAVLPAAALAVMLMALFQSAF